ncbi:MAG: alpha/beta fold hydrolase [Gaiellales bacterium]
MDESQANRDQDRQEPTWGLGAMLDPVSFAAVLREVSEDLARHPGAALGAWARWTGSLALAGTAVLSRTLGVAVPGPAQPEAGDRRFADPTWDGNPLYFGMLQGYLLTARLLRDLVAASELEPRRKEKAEFAAQHLIDSLAPTNFLPSNPAALKRAFETGGASLARGLRNFLEDVASNGGWPRQVDTDAFTVGGNLAATPGEVVYRNRLIELIQFAPQTETVFEVPLLLSPPWINKYYVMDLAPGKSFAEWAIRHGHTVFVISYRNPDESLRDVGMEDYLLEGPRAALDAIAEITGSTRTNVVGLCLGGTLTAILAAYLADRGEDRLSSLTLLNTLLDFSEPGPLGAFVDPETVERLEKRMERQGYLGAREMSGTFNLLRANDLIWSYVASNWLLGEDPPAFDILAWNRDSTRMPRRMHSEYLRSCYLDNALAGGTIELAGTPIRLPSVIADAYILAAREDHIAPWRSSYRSTRLLGGEPTFVLTSSGHVAGIVNPPGPKRSHWTNPAPTADPEAWLGAAEEHPGSWWEHWVAWIETRSGERREPPPLGSEQHPPLAPAPGTYVRG